MSGFRRNKKGFTLIEVLVVIAIIGILGAIATVSTVAALRNSERKAAETALTNYWRLTSQYLDQVNKRMTTSYAPEKNALAARIGRPATEIELNTAPCKSLSDNMLYIQYAENEKSINNRYTVVAIVYNYEGKYYKTTDGKTFGNPTTSL